MMPSRNPILTICFSFLLCSLITAGAGASQSTQETPSRVGDAYPLNVCAVTGEPLGANPVVVILSGMPKEELNGREVRFCCGGCKGTFDADPIASNKKLDEMIIADQLTVYPAGTCIVMEDEMMTDPTGPDARKDKNLVIGNRLFRLCCKSCVRRFKKNQEQYRKVLDERIIKEQAAKYPLEVCVITGRPYGESPFELVVANRLVRTCCGGCGQGVRNNPGAAIQKLQEADSSKASTSESKKTGTIMRIDS